MMHLTVCYYHVTYEFQSESSFAKWLSVRLRTNSLWVRISLLSLITKYKIGSTSNLGAETWNLLLGEIKISFSFSIFKNEIRNWIPEKCPCKLCKKKKKISVIFDFSQIFVRLAVLL